MKLITLADFRTPWQAVFLFAPAEAWTTKKAASYLFKAKQLSTMSLSSPSQTEQKKLKESAQRAHLFSKVILAAQWPLHLFFDTPSQLLSTLPFVITSQCSRLNKEIKKKQWGLAIGRAALFPLLSAGETTLIATSVAYKALINLMPFKAIKAWQPQTRIDSIQNAKTSLRFSRIEHWADISYAFKSKKAFLKEFPPSDIDLGI